MRYPVQQVAESTWIRTKPDRLSFWTDFLANLGGEKRLQIPKEIVGFGSAGFVLDVIRRVVVHAIEIVASLDQGNFFGREFRESVAELFAHGGWIVSVVDRVGEPSNGEFEFSFGCFYVVGVGRVPGVGGIAVQGDAYLTFVFRLEFFLVELCGASMGD